MQGIIRGDSSNENSNWEGLIREGIGQLEKMRAGICSVQQTLTPEAGAILKHAIAEACRRGHVQATPLHVAATLLSSPGSPLRRACLQTHPHSSYLPHCRALELCFNIALERLQAAQGPLPGGQPSCSNALVAALKRAQAHQRRGCPEQQQQPLLAVKVELEQLVISILDDPSVSRVMREAGFSSTDVKNHLEGMVNIIAPHHVASSLSSDHTTKLPWGTAMDQMGRRLSAAPSFLANITLPQHLSQYNGLSLDRHDTQLRLCPPATASPYLNPLFQQSPSGESAHIEGCAKRVFEILLKTKRRNPVLVGDSATSVEAVVRDLMRRIQTGDVPEQLRGVKFLHEHLSILSKLSASKEDLEMKFIKLNNDVQKLMPGGAIIHLGDLHWLLDLSQRKGLANWPSGFCPVQYAAVEIRQLLSRYLGSGRMWLIGTASSQTYLHCQMQHPTLESQWELQPFSISSVGLSLSLPSRHKSHGTTDTACDSSLSLALHLLPTAALEKKKADEDGEKLNCCADCMAKYEEEILMLHEQERRVQSESPQSCSSSVETTSKDFDSVQLTRAAQPALPLWLQKALPASNIDKAESVQSKDKTLLQSQRSELQKKWNQVCHSLHGHQHRAGSNLSSEEKLQQPSPSSSQISGGSSARFQEQVVSLLRDNLSSAADARSGAILPSEISNHQTQHARPGIGHPISVLQNVLNEYQQQLDAQKERLQESTCVPSRLELPKLALSAGTQMAQSTGGGTPGAAQNAHPTRVFHQMDPDALSQLCKGLAARVGWQKHIISTIAMTVLRCRSGMGNRRGVSLKCDTWLLFLGFDRCGKKKMAAALSELIFGCELVCLTFGREQDPSAWGLSRGKLPLDRLADTVRQNPFAVILLEDVDQADSMSKLSLLQAMKKGRLCDSNGREISFSNVIVVLTTSIGTECCDPGRMESKTQVSEEGFTIDSGASWQYDVQNAKHVADKGQLDNTFSENDQQFSGGACKRKSEWIVQNDPRSRLQEVTNKKTNLGQALSLDLNMSAEEIEFVDCSGRDTTCEAGESKRLSHEVIEEQVLHHVRGHLREFCDLVDAAVIFCPV